MMVVIEIVCDNAAFFDADDEKSENGRKSAGREVARILRKIAEDIKHGSLDATSGNLRDLNGNLVGSFDVHE